MSSFGPKFALLAEFPLNSPGKFSTRKERWQKLALLEGFSRELFFEIPANSPEIPNLPGKFA